MCISGHTVTLQDLEPRFIAPAIKRAHDLFREKLKEEYLVQKPWIILIPDVEGYGISKADVIIEAVIEDLSVKQTLRMIESKTAKRYLALHPLPLDDINTALMQPERLVGIHFFNPLSKMLLVEVVKGDRTSEKVMDKAVQFVRKIDRLPLPVKSSPGFLVNRILMPYLLGAVELVKQGIPMTAIDQAMKNFGMPMGPIALADTVGLDVCLSVAKYLGKY